ncbi:MAG: hypothetical protein C0520_09210 [Sphingopyxis sp.]|nr:hypothetical protein [Sphingopyxis sp.]
MTTSIIDGRVEAAELRRAKGGLTIFRSITFQPDTGPTRTIKNAVVKDNVASELVPGAAGRFYLYNAFDLKGVHGVRTRDGRSIYGFAANNKKLFLILGILNVAWIALRVFAIDGQVPLLAILLLILAVVGFIFMGKGENEAKAQFEGDAAYTPPA